MEGSSAMTLGASLWQLLIAPLELLLETVYGTAMNISGNQGVAIFLMSMVMNILLLPLYRRADAIQAKDREQQKKMEYWVRHIRRTFKGDERFMMLQTYYNQNHYKTWYSLRSSLPLALEIPFFMAAYHFLSNLSELRGAPLGPIPDLGAPDGLLALGSLTLNLLPLLMTGINVISSAVYTRGAPLKDKLMLYGMALIFLIFLYDSPAGLVFYWTLNNLFSLGKNLVYKLLEARGKRRENAEEKVRSVAEKALEKAGDTAGEKVPEKVPDMAAEAGEKAGGPGKGLLSLLSRKPDYRLFLCGGLLLALLTGVLIPSAVIASSPQEFVQLADFHSPLRHVANAALCAAGTFLIWFGVFYYLLSPRMKKAAEILIWLGAGCALVNYMFFGKGLGELTPNLTFKNDAAAGSGDAFALLTPGSHLFNFLILLLISGALLFLFVKRESLVRYCCGVLILAVACLSVSNIYQIHQQEPHLRASAERMQEEEKQTALFRLSKTGKNVVVIMLDRAVGALVPYIFEEVPGLEQQFAGFTWYPNTLSYGSSTNVGSPEIFGGYEYTPEEMNLRDQEPLVSKQNEALKVMPVLFDGAGYEVTVCDPVYAGYQWIPDLSIFDDYPQFHVYNTEQGQFNRSVTKNWTERQQAVWTRNFFCYSLMKTSPTALQPLLYQGGSYFHRSSLTQHVSDPSHAEGLNVNFLNSYSVLCSLPEMTEITETGDTYLALANSTTHEPCLLQAPGYTLSESVDNAAYDAARPLRAAEGYEPISLSSVYKMTLYHVNAAGLIQVGNWLDYLRENGVYDNTRIILVADHGAALYLRENCGLGPKHLDVVNVFNPLLMVKDFGASAFTRDDTLMTNADVPSLATEGLLEAPVNPFTKKPITTAPKSAEELHVVFPVEWNTSVNNGNTFLPGYWFGVRNGNMLDLNNWSELGTW